MTTKSFTDLEQSEKLENILPIESADCYWQYDKMQQFHRISWFEDGYNKEGQLRFNEYNVCAWSLAALLELIPERLYDKHGTPFDIEINKQNGMYSIFYEYDDHGIYHSVNTSCMDTLVDACYTIILKLNDLNLL